MRRCIVALGLRSSQSWLMGRVGRLDTVPLLLAVCGGRARSGALVFCH